jgi:hypothetical protein
MSFARVIAGAPMAMAAALLWRRVLSAHQRSDWYEPFPADARPPLDTAALFQDDALVTQLVCGDITGTEFRRSMEDLAALHAWRQPLVVPPAGGGR